MIALSVATKQCIVNIDGVTKRFTQFALIVARGVIYDTYVAIADPYYGTVWVTKPEFVNENGVYSYTSAALLQYEQDDEAEVIGKDERPLKMFRRNTLI